MSTAEVESAARGFADARADFAGHVRQLRHQAVQKAKSPYVLGGVAASVALAGLMVAKRKSTQPKRPPRKPSGDALVKWGQRLAPLLTAKIAGSAKERERPIPPPPPAALEALAANDAEGEPEAKAVDASHGWFGKQWALLKAAVKGWSDDYAPSMGAALSYYTLFSIAPLLIIVIGVAGLIFGQEAAQGEILGQLRGVMGDEGATMVEGMLKASRDTGQGIFATLVGAGVLLLGATAVFGELQSSLDRIWKTPAPKNESGLWHMLRTRLLSFGMVLGLGFLLMVSLVVSAALSALGKWWGGWLADWNVLLEALNFAVSLGLFTLLFAMIYKLMPRAKISWHDVWTGAAVTALLFNVGKVLIGLYLGRSSIASGFGAAGSLVVMVAWVYYSAQIFLLGAEYTWAYANAHGSHSKQPQPGTGSPSHAAAVPHRPE